MESQQNTFTSLRINNQIIIDNIDDFNEHNNFNFFNDNEAHFYLYAFTKDKESLSLNKGLENFIKSFKQTKKFIIFQNWNSGYIKQDEDEDLMIISDNQPITCTIDEILVESLNKIFLFDSLHFSFEMKDLNEGMIFLVSEKLKDLLYLKTVMIISQTTNPDKIYYTSLLEGLLNKSQLISLNLQLCKIGEEGADMIAQTIQHSQLLQNVYVTIDDDAISLKTHLSIFYNFSQLEKIETFFFQNMQGSKLTDTKFYLNMNEQDIAYVFQNLEEFCKKLLEIKIKLSRIKYVILRRQGDEQPFFIFNSFINSNNSQKISTIQQDLIEEEKIELQNSQQLLMLKNDLKEEFMNSIHQSLVLNSEIQQRQVLQSLNIYLNKSNKIGNQGAFTIAQFIENSQNLNFVNISILDNTISLEGQIAISHSISQLENLNYFKIQLSDQFKIDDGYLKISFKKCDQSFIESPNKFHRKLFDIFLKFSSIERVDLIANQINLKQQQYSHLQFCLNILRLKSLHVEGYNQELLSFISILQFQPQLKLTFSQVSTFNYHISEQKYLTTLKLVFNREISQINLKAFCWALSKHKQLSELEFRIIDRNTKLNQENSYYLCQSLQCLEQLKILSLAFNLDDDTQTNEIKDAIAQNKLINQLSLNIGRTNNGIFLALIQDLQLLKEESLKITNITDLKFSKLIINQEQLLVRNNSELQTNSIIIDLSFKIISLNKQGAEQLKEVFKVFRNLKTLAISVQNMDEKDEGAYFILYLGISHYLQQLTQIQLNINGNFSYVFYQLIEDLKNISMKGQFQLNQEVVVSYEKNQAFQLQNIEIIIIDYPLEQNGEDRIAQVCQSLRFFKYLQNIAITIGNFSYQFESLKYISEGLKELKMLESLKINSKNSINEKQLIEFTKNLSYSSQKLSQLELKFLKIQEETIEGMREVCNSLSDLKVITHLTLFISKYQFIFIQLLNELPLLHPENLNIYGLEITESHNFKFEQNGIHNKNTKLLLQNSTNLDNQNILFNFIDEGLSKIYRLRELTLTFKRKMLLPLYNSTYNIQLGSTLKCLSNLSYLDIQTEYLLNCLVISDNNEEQFNSFQNLQELRELKLHYGENLVCNYDKTSEIINGICLLQKLEELTLQIDKSSLSFFKENQNQFINVYQQNEIDVNFEITHLKNVSISINENNMFGNENLQNLIEFISKSRQLKNLNIQLNQNNYFTDDTLERFDRIIDNQETLRSISFEIQDSLSCDSLNLILSGLHKQKNLTHLKLTINIKEIFYMYNCLFLGYEISNLKELEEIQLCIQGSSQLCSFSNSLSNKPKLQKLELILCQEIQFHDINDGQQNNKVSQCKDKNNTILSSDNNNTSKLSIYQQFFDLNNYSSQDNQLFYKKQKKIFQYHQCIMNQKNQSMLIDSEPLFFNQQYFSDSQNMQYENDYLGINLPNILNNSILQNSQEHFFELKDQLICLGENLNSLENLKELKLHINQISSQEGIISLINGLENKNTLKKIDINLEQNEHLIDNEIIDLLSLWIKQMLSLEKIKIHIQNPYSISLLSIIQDLKNVENHNFLLLHVDNKTFQRDDEQNINQLNLSFKNINDFSLKGLEKAFYEMNQLTKLKIQFTQECRIDSEEGLLLGLALQYCLQLREITLSFNNITQSGAWQLGQYFKCPQQLKSFNCKIGSNNDFGIQGISSILALLSSTQNLSSFSFQIGSNNKASKQGIFSICQLLSNYQISLRSLKLKFGDNNNLSNGIIYIEEILQSLNNLQKLKIDIGEYNKISNLFSIVDSITRQQFLRELSFNIPISHNEIINKLIVAAKLIPQLKHLKIQNKHIINPESNNLILQEIQHWRNLNYFSSSSFQNYFKIQLRKRARKNLKLVQLKLKIKS